MSTNNDLSLSLVITSYTTERLNDIYELLDSIKEQTYRNMETIFVVERSEELRDKIGDFIKNNDIRKIKVIFNNGEQGASISRNIGVKNASGDIIAFVDDDVVLFSDWAYEMVKTYDDDTIIGVAGPALPLWEDESDAWLPEELYWIISCTAFTRWDKLRDTRNAWTTNASYHREVFDSGEFFSTRIGPKDKNGHREGWKWIAEDIELTSRVLRKIKKRVIYNPKVKRKHFSSAMSVTHHMIRVDRVHFSPFVY